MDKKLYLQVAGLIFVCLLLASLPGEVVSPTFTLAFVGDVMLGRGVARALDGDWQAAFASVQPWLAGADLAFANLESPLTSSPQVSNGYDLRAPVEAVAALYAAGFDVVSLANNHALDAGEAGLAETMATLNAAGITGLVDRKAGSLIGRQTPHQSTPALRAGASVRYQLLAFDDSTVPLDLEMASQRVVAAAEQADLVIVSMHWGGEYQAAPGPRQRSTAGALARSGADLIIGHGPHVLQPVEWVGETLVAYSLGNSLFDQPYPADCRWGAILRVTRSARGGRLAVRFFPTIVERGRVRPASLESSVILARLSPERHTD